MTNKLRSFVLLFINKISWVSFKNRIESTKEFFPAKMKQYRIWRKLQQKFVVFLRDVWNWDGLCWFFGQSDKQWKRYYKYIFIYFYLLCGVIDLRISNFLNYVFKGQILLLHISIIQKICSGKGWQCCYNFFWPFKKVFFFF